MINNLKMKLGPKLEICEQKVFMIVYQLYQNILCDFLNKKEEVLGLLKQMGKGMLKKLV